MTTASALIDETRPDKSRLARTLLLIVGGSLLCAVASQVRVPLPFTPVPVNGLTFAVLLLGATLDWRSSAVAVLLFLAEGRVGLPVFAGLNRGLATLNGPTGGYLMAAPLAAASVGLLLLMQSNRRILWVLTSLLIGDAIILGGGVAWLDRFLLKTDVLHAGLIPFIPGEAVKIALLMLILPVGWRWNATRRKELSDPRD